jgi:hypothetical protein
MRTERLVSMAPNCSLPKPRPPSRSLSDTTLYKEIDALMHGKTMDAALEDPYDRKAVITNLRTRRLHARSGSMVEGAYLKLSKYGPLALGGAGFGYD